MEYGIRKIKESEAPILEKFLYEAIFVPEGVEAPPRDIVEMPELQVYIKDFGKRKGDYCYIAKCDGEIVGAAWTRIMNDYGM